ncbi:hypothetical protein CYY_001076 [Polysphondylium violaceum]|uniref:Uncharacterized protein n=1 Tax=Polysphondylium violaceum TaxID=133409 RepID=A0A8J4PYQ8_9MYCE|nr:hypothetical protein CYY_001076 [Polysphondylium violaceum]
MEQQTTSITPPSTPSFTSMSETESSITLSINSTATSPSCKTPSTISETNHGKHEKKPDGVLILEMEDNKKVLVTEEDFEKSFNKKNMKRKPIYRLLTRNICIGVICLILAAVIALIIVIVKLKS